jgi:hypothetical protein
MGDLTERAITSLLHAMNRWPSAVNIHLWPYMPFDSRMTSTMQLHPQSRLAKPLSRESFSSTPVRPQILNYHPPLCPVYVLHIGLHGGGKRPNKWVRRSRIAIYLGSSPRHARSVAIVLSLTTGYVSPQFHLKFDDFLETVQDVKSLPPSKWQILARFGTTKGEPPKTHMPSLGARTSPQNSRSLPQSVNQDPLEFDFVEPGGDEGASNQHAESGPELPALMRGLECVNCR